MLLVYKLDKKLSCIIMLTNSFHCLQIKTNINHQLKIQRPLVKEFIKIVSTPNSQLINESPQLRLWIMLLPTVWPVWIPRQYGSGQMTHNTYNNFDYKGHRGSFKQKQNSAVRIALVSAQTSIFKVWLELLTFSFLERKISVDDSGRGSVGL